MSYLHDQRNYEWKDHPVKIKPSWLEMGDTLVFVVRQHHIRRGLLRGRRRNPVTLALNDLIEYDNEDWDRCWSRYATWYDREKHKICANMLVAVSGIQLWGFGDCALHHLAWYSSVGDMLAGGKVGRRLRPYDNFKLKVTDTRVA